MTSKFKIFFLCGNVSPPFKVQFKQNYLFRFRNNVDRNHQFTISSWLKNFDQPFLRVCTYHFKFCITVSHIITSASKRKGIWHKPSQSQQTRLLYLINPWGFATIWLSGQAIRVKWTLAFSLTREMNTFLSSFRIFLLCVPDKKIAVYQEMKKSKMLRYLN